MLVVVMDMVMVAVTMIPGDKRRRSGQETLHAEEEQRQERNQEHS
jgi:hypothetical protein